MPKQQGAVAAGCHGAKDEEDERFVRRILAWIDPSLVDASATPDVEVPPSTSTPPLPPPSSGRWPSPGVDHCWPSPLSYPVRRPRPAGPEEVPPAQMWRPPPLPHDERQEETIDLAAMQRVAEKVIREAKRKTADCLSWDPRLGRCRYGVRCLYRHPNECRRQMPSELELLRRITEAYESERARATSAA